MRYHFFLSWIIMLSVSVIHAKVIIVPDQSPSIQAAIDKADSGDTVKVRSGIWKESILLKDDIALIGESMTGTVIRGRLRGPVVCGANGSLIKSLSITHGRTGILCENVDLTIEQVIVRGNGGTGIHCLVSLPNIFNSVIYRNRGAGIMCEGTRSIKTSIMHNVIAENGYCGIMLQGVSEVLIQNNVFLGNREYGIWGMAEARRSRIIYNDFFNNRSSVNNLLTEDMTNIHDNPGFPQTLIDYDFFSKSGVGLKGRGKDGATIGLIGGEVLRQQLKDPDDDGIPGTDDACPSIPEDKDGFDDHDGCPEFDNDKDGIFDDADACPNSPEDFDQFHDEDGCTDPDNDKDGIPDSIDVCKSNSETANGYKDDDGCPDEVQPPTGNTGTPSATTPAQPVPQAIPPDSGKIPTAPIVPPAEKQSTDPSVR